MKFKFACCLAVLHLASLLMAQATSTPANGTSSEPGAVANTVINVLSLAILVAVLIAVILIRARLAHLTKQGVRANNLNELEPRLTRLDSFLEQVGKQSAASTQGRDTSDAAVQRLTTELAVANRDLQQLRQNALRESEALRQANSELAQLKQASTARERFFAAPNTVPNGLGEALKYLTSLRSTLQPSDRIDELVLSAIVHDAENLQVLFGSVSQAGFTPSRSGNYRPVTLPNRDTPMWAARDPQLAACTVILEWCRAQLLRQIETAAKTKAIVPIRGDAFDARRHELEKTIVADDPSLAGRVARLVEMGFEDFVKARVVCFESLPSEAPVAPNIADDTRSAEPGESRDESRVEPQSPPSSLDPFHVSTFSPDERAAKAETPEIVEPEIGNLERLLGPRDENEQ